jgi:hypothetical protein
MADQTVTLRVPYRQEFVRKGRRNSETVSFWSELPVEIRIVAPEQIVPAFRITKEGGQSSESFTVHSFANGLWWPLTYDGEPMSPAIFVTLASSGDGPLIADSLGVDWDWPEQQPEEHYYGKNIPSKIISCTRERQWARAQRATREWVIFCGDEVLLEAGEPSYFIVPPQSPTRYKIVVRSPYLDRDPNLQSRTIGAARTSKQSSAQFGMAFGVDEIKEGVRHLGERSTEGYVSRIEPLTVRAPTGAAAASCARAFIDLLWANAQLNGPRGRALQRFVPILAEVRLDIERLRREPARAVLGQVASIQDETGRKELRSEIETATGILSRLVSLATFATEDEEALAQLGRSLA